MQTDPALEVSRASSWASLDSGTQLLQLAVDKQAEAVPPDPPSMFIPSLLLHPLRSVQTCPDRICMHSAVG